MQFSKYVGNAFIRIWGQKYKIQNSGSIIAGRISRKESNSAISKIPRKKDLP